MSSEIYNRLFNRSIPEGAEGGPAHVGLFVKDRLGLYMRITQSEGNEIAYNPETQTRHLIGFESPSDTVRQYQLNLSKGMIVRKGDREYEFFNRFAEKRPTGTNAQLQMMIVDFRKDTPGTGGRFDYLAFEFTATTTINTANHTDGVLDISFGQASDLVKGIASSAGFDDANQNPVFVPSTEIPITEMRLSSETVSVAPGKEAWVAVDFEPLGCPDEFEIVRTGTERYDESVCSVRRQIDSVVITGRNAGATSVTIRSTADRDRYKTISVSVGGTVQAGLPAGASGGLAPAKAKATAPTE